MGKILRSLFNYFYPILMIDYYLIVRGINLNTLIVLPIFFILAVVAVKIMATKGRQSFIMSMNLFLIYCLLTVFWYLFNDAPFTCYTTMLRSFVFPIIFAYLGCQYSSDHVFNKWYVYACGFCFLVGFYLYLETPQYYLRFLAEARDNAFNARSDINESNVIEYTRFSSFFATSYAVSCFSVPALILSLSFALKSKIGWERVVFYIIAFSSILAALLCQQRIAIGSTFVVLIFWVFYSSSQTNTKGLFGVIMAYTIVILLSIYMLGLIVSYEWFGRVSDMVTTRLGQMDFVDAMDHRKGQYTSFDRMTDFSLVFGLGLGSCGHAAVAAGLRGIADGEFIKLFYEFGVVGMALLASIIIPTLYRGIKFFKYYYIEVIIILFYLAAGIASDSLTFFIYSIMFWYSLGRIWNKNYFNRLQQEKTNKANGIIRQ